MTITTSRGLQPYTLEGKMLSLEVVNKFLRDYQEYASRMAEGVADGIPDDQKQVLKDFHNAGQAMNEEKGLRALKRVAGAIER